MSNTDTRYSTPPQVEMRADNKPVLVGYAAKFGTESQDLGGFVETINARAFDDSLAENPDVSARIQHQGGLSTIGRTRNGTLKLSVDKVGLKYEVAPPNTQAGRDIVELVRGGFINKSSFAFSVRPNGDRWDFSTTPAKRELLSVSLADIAPVDGPAYIDTSVAVRSMEAAKKAAPEPTVVDITGNRKTGWREFVPGEKNADGSVTLDEQALQAIANSRAPKPEFNLKNYLKDQYDYLKSIKPAK